MGEKKRASNEGPVIGDFDDRTQALQRVLDLPLEEMLSVHLAVDAYLCDLGTRELPDVKQHRERAETLVALRAAAERIAGGGEIRAPTIREYRGAADKLGLELSAETITRRWGGVWRLAGDALMGVRVSETPEQASLRMKAGAKTGARGEVPVEVPIRAVRAWLESEPESLAVTHYAQWVKQENRKLPEPERYPTPPGVIKVLLLSWEKAIEVSRPGSKLDVATARHAYLAELKAKSVAEHRVGSGAEGLCNMTGVALVLGQTRNRVRQDFRKGLLPPHVAVWSSSPVWYWSDVEGRAHGQPDPDRPAGGLQDELLNSVKLAARLKRTTKTLGLALSAASPTVPPPAGRIGRDAYWLKSEVEPWLAEHRHLIGASPAELARWTKAVKRAR